MPLVSRIALLLVGLIALSLPRSTPAAAVHGVFASVQDRHEVAIAARLAGHSAGRATAWLRGQRTVERVDQAGDGTIDIHFRDGADVAILPRTVARDAGLSAQLRTFVRFHPLGRFNQTSSSNRAIVLEPFADQLQLGPDAGQAEADLLTKAGFTVDILRNTQVTVKALEKLGSYSVVYMETHSNILPSGPDQGDAIIVARDTNNEAYAGMFGDGSLMQATIYGDPTGTLYDALKAKFFTLHTGPFPNSSMIFINGCAVVGAPVFWSALQASNVSTLIGWDEEVYSSISDLAAVHLFTDLAAGSTVDQAVTSAHAVGLGTSQVGGTIAQLSYSGDGSDTLTRAVAGIPAPTATPVPGTPTVTPTITPSPTPTSKPALLHLKLKVRSTLHAHRNGTLWVYIRNSHGHPVNGAKVALYGHGITPTRQAKSNKQGTVVFKNVRVKRAGMIVLKGSKTGYRTAAFTLHIL